MGKIRFQAINRPIISHGHNSAQIMLGLGCSTLIHFEEMQSLDQDVHDVFVGRFGIWTLNWGRLASELIH